MKVSVLVENTKQSLKFQEEHGLSLCLETKEHCILFDMGQSDAFMHNAQMLGVDLQKVDIAILSHGHYDHGGGLEAFLKINTHAKIYLSKYAFDAHYSQERYIGLKESLKNNERFIFVDDILEIDTGFTLYSCNDLERVYEVPNTILKAESNGNIELDDFKHELYLLVKEDEKDILISGCSHKGILNIMHWFKPHILIGGFHLKDFDLDNASDLEYLNTTAINLLSYNTRYYTCHCTGLTQFKHVEKHLENTIKYISTGEVFYV